MKREKKKKVPCHERPLGSGTTFIFPKEEVETPTQSHTGLEEALKNIT